MSYKNLVGVSCRRNTSPFGSRSIPVRCVALPRRVQQPSSVARLANRAPRPPKLASYLCDRTLALGLVILLLSGCFHSAELAQVRRDIEKEVPQADFDRELELTLGPMTLGFVRLLSVFVPNIREERGFLKEIDQIKVAVYKIRSMPPLDDCQPPWHLGTQRRRSTPGTSAMPPCRISGRWNRRVSRGDITGSTGVRGVDPAPSPPGGECAVR